MVKPWARVATSFTARLSFLAASATRPVRGESWAFDPNAPLSPISISAYLGGKVDEGGASGYELGLIASQERTDLLALFPRVGAAHGFDISFPVVGSGRQRICVYALDIGPGSDELLGCRKVGVPVPIAVLRTKVVGNAVRVTLRCDWPFGTDCPGQILVRGRFAQSFVVRRHGGRRVVRTKMVRRSIARRAFRLTGGKSHTFQIALGQRGRLLSQLSDRPQAHLLVAIPGGRVGQQVQLR